MVVKARRKLRVVVEVLLKCLERIAKRGWF